MSVRLLSPSSPESKNPLNSIATESGSQSWVHPLTSGIVEYFENKRNSLSSDNQRLIILNVTSSSRDLETINELTIKNEIDIEDWKQSLDYSDEEIEKLSGELLEDYEINVNSNNLEWFRTVIDSIIKNYEKAYSLSLKEETRKMIRNLVTKMSYDKLTVKKYLN